MSNSVWQKFWTSCCGSKVKQETTPMILQPEVDKALFEWEQKAQAMTEPEEKKKSDEKNLEQLATSLKEQLQLYEDEICRSHADEDTVYEISLGISSKRKKCRKKRKDTLHKSDDVLPNGRCSLSSAWCLSTGESMESLSKMPVQKIPFKRRKRKDKHQKFKTAGKLGMESDLMSIDLFDCIPECCTPLPMLIEEILLDAKGIPDPESSVGSGKQLPNYTPEQIASLSRHDEAAFAQLLKHNTKHSLFDSQPTVEEVDMWNQGKARPGPTCTLTPVIHEPPIETRQFCALCKPRHWQTACKEKSRSQALQDAKIT